VLRLRPSVRGSWFGLAAAMHMMGHTDGALSVIDAHEQATEAR
jgi:hypothetical protein